MELEINCSIATFSYREPNHVHAIISFTETTQSINTIIGNEGVQGIYPVTNFMDMDDVMFTKQR